MTPPGVYHKSNGARDCEKPAQVHQGQIVLDTPDRLLGQNNLLGGCGASSGHCLSGFLQGF